MLPRVAVTPRRLRVARNAHGNHPVLAITVWPDWEVAWTALRDREGSGMSLDEAVEQVREWITELASM